jgi:hypothetical protein
VTLIYDKWGSNKSVLPLSSVFASAQPASVTCFFFRMVKAEGTRLLNELESAGASTVCPLTPFLLR